MRFVFAVWIGMGLALGCSPPPREVVSEPEQPAPVPATPRPQAESLDSKPIEFQASDGVTVFGDLYPTSVDTRSIFLLFHKAGGNAGEYETIAPRLAELGFDAIAIDQRSGGDDWDRKNRTVAKLGRSEPYEAALVDLVGALEWAVAQGKYTRILVWGSSYSASLAFRLAAYPDVAGIIASSPGEYFVDRDAVKAWAATVDRFPVLITSTPEEAKAEAKGILEGLPTPAGPAPHRLVSHEGGVHGASAVVKELCSAADRYWSDVRGYLELLRPRRPVEFQGVTETTTD